MTNSWQINSRAEFSHCCPYPVAAVVKRWVHIHHTAPVWLLLPSVGVASTETSASVFLKLMSLPQRGD